MIGIEYAAKRARELMEKPEVIEAMAIRCEDQGHEWENCASIFLRIYQACKWCGAER